ncbi:MAG TPA: hypothetical protein VM390_03110, partial [Acidimicrobiales bacterium]|nr:hypothetical protein [Acidimicrobiales bacterium]
MVLALAATGCGTMAGGDLGDEVSAGPRPTAVDGPAPELTNRLRTSDGLAQPVGGSEAVGELG